MSEHVDNAGGALNHQQDRDLEIVGACLVCGNTKSSVFLDVGEWRLRKCQGCGLVFTSPRLTSPALAALYESGYYEGTENYFQSQAIPASQDQLAIARSAKRRVKAAAPASLDVGTGAGRMVEAFGRAGFFATGIEPSAAACAVAQQIGRSVTQRPLQDEPTNSYDCVTLFHVLEHIGEPLPFLQHIHRVTRPAGLVIVEVPNIESHSAKKMGAGWPHLYPDTHLAHYSPASLSEALRRTGFTVERIERVGGAGLFAGHTANPSVTAAAASRSESSCEPERCRQKQTVRSVLWANRQKFLAIPGVRRFVRWVNWEVLGLGHFIRVHARR